MNDAVPHRRRRHYIDARLQGRLLAWLVTGELLLFGAALVAVWWGMDAAVEASLYRIHPRSDSLPVLLRQLLWIVPIILVVNLLAVALIERHWRRRVAAIVARLEPLIARIGHGDLRPPPVNTADTLHPVLEAAQAWRSRERDRFDALQRIIETLPEDFPSDPDAARSMLAELQRRQQA